MRCENHASLKSKTLTWYNRVCRDAAPSDLQYLTDDNIVEIGMNHLLLWLGPGTC